MSDRRAVAVVDTGAIERNCARLRRELSEGAALCVVVKADGYGHGAAQAGEAALAAGATMLAVASAGEARELRAAHPQAPLLTLGALTDAELETAIEAGSELAVWHRDFLDAAAAHGRRLGIRPRVHVKYDTGMGRLGERDPRTVAELVTAAASSDGVELAGLWTHFATADDPASRFFDEQLARFEGLARELRREHPGLVVHAANSAAVLRDPASHFDMVRCGIAAYGLDPFNSDPRDCDLEPALELRSYVAAVRRFEPGDTAGYGQRWRAPIATWVATLPIGYGDGVRRGLSNRGQVLVAGRRHPIVGAVSMDNVTLDLGPDGGIQSGEDATLIGAQGEERILCEEVAGHLATINYEVVTQISPRVPRHYVRS